MLLGQGKRRPVDRGTAPIREHHVLTATAFGRQKQKTQEPNASRVQLHRNDQPQRNGPESILHEDSELTYDYNYETTNASIKTHDTTVHCFILWACSATKINKP